ncbi:MAG: hypothetical protein ACK518_03420 [bacterium]
MDFDILNLARNWKHVQTYRKRLENQIARAEMLLRTAQTQEEADYYIQDLIDMKIDLADVRDEEEQYRIDFNQYALMNANQAALRVDENAAVDVLNRLEDEILKEEAAKALIDLSSGGGSSNYDGSSSPPKRSSFMD